MLKENDSLVQVKICGLTSMDDVHIIEKYGADYAGMVLFYPKSRRNIDITLAEMLVAKLKKSDIKTVAVLYRLMYHSLKQYRMQDLIIYRYTEN